MKRFLILIIAFATVLIGKSQNTENSDSLKREILRELLELKIDTTKVLFNRSQDIEYKYFVKRKSLSEGYYLELKPATPKDSVIKAKYGERIDERDSFLDYSNFQKAEILKELLSFQGDTTKSSKSYKIKTPDLRRIEVQPFTIQIEALYTFSRMLLIGFPYFLPKLTDKNEKVNYNGCQPVIDEVYGIYRQWLQNTINNDFKNLTLPMTGTKYQWQRQQTITDKWFIDFHRNDKE